MMRTSLYDEHLKLGGRMVEFAGWELPVMYSSIVEEHIATRTRAALFDVSHMGEFTIRGKDAASLLRGLIPTSLDRVSDGGSMYSCFCNERGGVVDDIFIFKNSDTDYYLVVNAATREKDFRWINAHRKGDAEVIDESDSTSKIDIQGPLSAVILKQVINDPALDRCGRFRFFTSTFNGARVMISQTGYTGEQGYELFIENAMAPSLWNALLETGRDRGIAAAGLGARDTLRLEACYSLYGHELSDDISPVEAGLRWLVNSDDDYIGKDIVLKQKTDGAPREMVCFELTGRGVPREKCAVYKNGALIGHSTSGGYSPTFKKGIGLALVERGSLRTGDEFSLEI
ncbi:MAG TPA: glycine cleavage system aminomethyltransferase GcvT, partial [Spirochaetes bacterium]|nr:glycine cleavage system aminomethyltransferase GcvT [Spirochaetota bacterium]